MAANKPSTPRSSPKGVKVIAAAPAPPPERVKTPPPEPSEPSGYVMALTRLLDLEAQMEFEFAKHMQLVAKQHQLKAQREVLQDLPVGIEALIADLEQAKAADDEGGAVTNANQ